MKWLLSFFLAFGFTLSGAITPARVLVVYQTNAPDKDGDGVGDSLELAMYYCQKRGVPTANMVGVTPTVATIYAAADYGKFQSEIVGPIKATLAKIGPQNIDVILIAGALPTKVTNVAGSVRSLDNALIILNYWSPSFNNLQPFTSPYGASLTEKPSFGTDAPRFDHSFNFAGTTMYLVARLGVSDALHGMEELDQDLYAERYLSNKPGGYWGTGYVDSRYGIPVGMADAGKPYTDAWLTANVSAIDPTLMSYANADAWIAYTEHFIAQAGFPLKWEQSISSIGDAGATITNATRALWYGGWYNFDKYNDVWDWLPGSVACDLNSAPVFGQQAIAHGASNTLYVIAEAGLNGGQRTDILFYYLLRGYTFAEASALSGVNVGWMDLDEGDPLYAPMAPRSVTLDTHAPTIAPGYPRVAKVGSTADWLLSLMVDDSTQPELVSVRVDYGVTSVYGSTKTSGRGYWKHLNILLAGLVADTAYHYKLTLTDPVGNVSSTPDLTFTTAQNCDLNGDGKLDIFDVQLAVQSALGTRTCGSADVNGDGRCDVRDVQLEAQSVLAGVCVLGH